MSTQNVILRDRYQLENLLGSGFSSRVYYARDLRNQDTVAIKYIPRDTDNIRLGLNEFSHLLSLKHPNIVSCFDFMYQENGDVYLVYEYIGGGSLRDRLENTSQPFDDEKVYAILDAALSSLVYLHERKLLHGDVKPENILFQKRDDTLKLIDFGLSSKIENRKKRLRNIPGTPAYLAPECFSGETSLQSDLYSLGICAFEMLTGCLPFTGTPESVAEAHLNKQPDWSKIQASQWIRWIETILAKTPQARFASANAAQKALRSLMKPFSRFSYAAIDRVPKALPDTKVSSLGPICLFTDYKTVFENVGIQPHSKVLPLFDQEGASALTAKDGNFVYYNQNSPKGAFSLLKRDARHAWAVGFEEVLYVYRGYITAGNVIAGSHIPLMEWSGSKIEHFAISKNGHYLAWSDDREIYVGKRLEDQIELRYSLPITAWSIGRTFSIGDDGQLWQWENVLHPVLKHYSRDGLLVGQTHLKGLVNQMSEQGPGFLQLIPLNEDNYDEGETKLVHFGIHDPVEKRILPGQKGDFVSFQGAAYLLTSSSGVLEINHRLEPNYIGKFDAHCQAFSLSLCGRALIQKCFEPSTQTPKRAYCRLLTRI